MNFLRMLALSGALVSTASLATIDLGSETIPFARQIADGTPVNWPFNEAVNIALGFGISDGDERFIRIDIENATFTVAPEATNSNLRCNPAGVDMINPACEFAVGVSNTSFFVFGLSANGANLPPTQNLQFRIHRLSRNPADTNPAVDPDLVLQSVDESTPVNLRYRLYEDPIEANNGSTATLVDSGFLAIAEFVDGLVVDTGDTPTCVSDVTQGSLVFEDNNGANEDDTCNCGQVRVRRALGPNWIDGEQVQIDDILADGSAFLIEGELAFADGGTPDPGVFIDDGPGPDNCDFVSFPGVLGMDSATITTDDTPFGNLDNPASAKFCLSGNQVDPFPVGDYTATFVPVAAGDAEVVDRPLGTICTLEKNGSEDALVFNLTRDGFYTQFIRVTNPTFSAGRVFLTCFDDAADQVSDQIALSSFTDRTGETLPAVLGANESTDLIDINNVWETCGITPAGGPGSPNGNFLRILAEGEFGDTGPTTGQGEAIGIRIEGLTVSRDGNSFENTSR